MILHERYSSEVFWTVSKHSTCLPVSLFLPGCTRILQGPDGYLDEERASKHHLLQLQRSFAGQFARKHGPSWAFGKYFLSDLFSSCNISGRLCIRSLLGSLHFNAILPSEHNKDSHAEDSGWRVSELPQRFLPLVERARRLGDVQGGARQLHALLHVLGNHKHELLCLAPSAPRSQAEGEGK